MPLYVIERKRNEFVSDPSTNGTGKSYSGIHNATLYPSRAQAERDACKNEHVRPLESIIQGRRA